MTTKKTTRKKSKKRMVLPTDPPILVGGGGSSIVWIRKDQEPMLVDPNGVPASAPQPAHPSLYYAFRCRDNHVSVTVNDGNVSDLPKPVNGRRHVTSFE